MEPIIFIDTEVGLTDKMIHDLGAVRDDGSILHTGKSHDLIDFIGTTRFVCGHNLIHHDMTYLGPVLDGKVEVQPIDTLYLSPLLFPRRPYHALLKDDKLQTDELNNPVNDCKKARQLFEDEVAAFECLPKPLKKIFYHLLHDVGEFRGFFEYVGYTADNNQNKLFAGWFSKEDYGIHDFFKERICAHADVLALLKNSPVELAYALALIHAGDSLSIVPPWTLKNYPQIYNIIVLLRNHPCKEGCPYCQERLNATKALQKYFGYPSFRTYNGEPLQERAVQAAIDGKSLLVVFPTGGGKSLTFQIPALMAGENSHGLTVVISPLQSLMKDQVDNLRNAGISGAVTVNGLLSPIERAEALKEVADGSASLLYISPEMLRSKTIEKLLTSRNVVRFVIDEAHCFSSWGQDFRIDYLYIGDFIRKLQKNKANRQTIAVSCFTATAKQKVISDIRDYFKEKLGVDLEIYASNVSRQNLTYNVLYKESDEEKYTELRNLIERKDCPTIVYVSRTKRTFELSRRLTDDGFTAKPFNGKMSPREKIENQEAFIEGRINIIVATSAFGMGVDKSDVGLVIHYDISDSLENYIQESGRAGRDQSLHADCYVLYNEQDLDKHFILLNQTKISQSDIQQVWQAIKKMTGTRRRICSSALEIARAAGWDSSVAEIEMRVKTAIAALENAGYVKRGNNMPRVFASGILVKNMDEATQRIERSTLLKDEARRTTAKRIISSLISSRSIAEAGNDDAESRVDYLADILGLKKSDVISTINLLREDGLLADTQDMSAYLLKDDTLRKTNNILDRFEKLEGYLLSLLEEGNVSEFNLKTLNEQADAAGITTANVKDIRTILSFLAAKQYIHKEEYKGSSSLKIVPQLSGAEIGEKFRRRIEICRFAIREFYADMQDRTAQAQSRPYEKEILVGFSLVALHNKYCQQCPGEKTSQNDVQDALLYLTRIGAMRLEGGFLVLYNAMEINRLVMDNHIRYKREDYLSLNEYYKQKIQQIHIVGVFANMMVRDYAQALQFVNDYFQMDYRKFIGKYFKADQIENLSRNMTSQRFDKLFGCLSERQRAIINDDESKHIVVVAGPGSGKTRVLVHKLAAMLTLEDVKHEQLLMVTFSRAAATEFKMRLKDLIGNAANFVEIKTFHSYCFDLMGRIGNLQDLENVVRRAVEMIQNGDVEPERIAKSVLVIDEAQDMDADEFNLVCALMAANDGMRVIAVGDDDQNIYEFRGSDSKYMRRLVTDYEARMYELVENYRSRQNLVTFSNAFAHCIKNRMKNHDIVAVNKDGGSITTVSYSMGNIEEPMIDHLAHHLSDSSVCVMAATNDEVFRILGLLLKRGIRAKLIQSNEEFSLYNLAEVRCFLKLLSSDREQSQRSQSPIISEDRWEQAKEQLRARYGRSTCLENCMQMISAFEETYPRKYRSDLEEFIRESHFEDFYKEEQGAVFVSTIHKTKGREFDRVYLLLNGFHAQQDAELRKLYVALTRTRNELYVHYCNTPLIDRITGSYISHVVDNRRYNEPDEIALQLTHKDVWLDHFKAYKREILSLQSGMPLEFVNGGLAAEVNGRHLLLVRFSKSCTEKLQTLCQKGYRPTHADIRFIIAWRKEEDPTETAVILPSIYLRRG